MNLDNIVEKYGTQVKEKISDVYDNHKRKILIGTLGSSLLLNSGCLTTALVGGAAGGLPGAIVGSLAGDTLTYRREKDEKENDNLVIMNRSFNNKPRGIFSIRAPPLDGSPMYIDVDKNGILDKIYIDPQRNKRSKVFDLYIEYGKPDGTFEEPEFLAETAAEVGFI